MCKTFELSVVALCAGFKNIVILWLITGGLYCVANFRNIHGNLYAWGQWTEMNIVPFIQIYIWIISETHPQSSSSKPIAIVCYFSKYAAMQTTRCAWIRIRTEWWEKTSFSRLLSTWKSANDFPVVLVWRHLATKVRLIGDNAFNMHMECIQQNYFIIAFNGGGRSGAGSFNA